MKLLVLAATASVSSALGPLAPSVSARDMMPKKLGARWYTGYQTAYPNGAKDMPDAPPETLGHASANPKSPNRPPKPP